jgi:hypothetical protein
MITFYSGSYALWACLSRDVNFGGRFVVLVRTSSLAKIFSSIWTLVVARQTDFFPAEQTVARRLERESAMTSPIMLAESAGPAQNAFIADTDGDFLAIEEFEQRNGIFAGYTEKIFEFDRGDFAMLA